jgi:beta-hydroxylase
MNLADFPELKEVQDQWEVIRDEAVALREAGNFDQVTDPNSKAYYDIGFRTFYKYGWSKFYLTWYGTKLNSAKKLCPKTVEIISKIPNVNGAMFSVLPPGSKLTKHLDPVATSLRYHLGLKTPNDDNAFINIDGTSYSWRDGDALLFDETYLHYAKNDTEKDRVILMLEVDRPTGIIGKIINFFFKQIMRITVVPNMAGDQRGLVNAIFGSISPTILKVRTLKETNMALYKVVKHSVNFTLLLLVLGILYSVINFITSLF